jgi:hypothetical protein
MVRRSETDKNAEHPISAKTDGAGVSSRKLTCVGTLCFDEDEVKVVVNKEASEECRKKLNEYLTDLDKKIVFEMEKPTRVKQSID